MPIVNFGLEAGNTFAILERFHQLVGINAADLNHLAVNFTRVNAAGDEYVTSISGITAANQRLTATLREEAGAIQLVNLRLDNNIRVVRAAAAAAATVARRGDAYTARQAITGGTNFAGLTPSEVNAVNSRINSITSSIARGRTTLAEFNTAAAAAAGTFPVAVLNEAEHRILNTLQRITAAEQRATERARALLTRQREQGQNVATGQALLQNYRAGIAPQLNLLNPAATERVRNQIDKINNLFERGLTGANFLRGFNAFETGVVAGLTRTEREVRHRLERIRIELERAPRPGLFNRFFGNRGGPGGEGQTTGYLDQFGGTGKVVGGLILAKGALEATEKLKALATDTATYGKQIALLQTLTQDTAQSFDQWSTSILKVSGALGKSRGEIAEAAYDLLSNQITKGVEDTETALTAAGKFAVATNSSTQDSVNLLSSVINSFGYDVGSTEKILSKLFTVIDLGRVKASDLANSMGRPGIAARSLGVSFEELSAAQITISQTGLGAEQTNTLITNVFHKLLNPTKELQEIYDKLGVSTGENFVKTYGFAGALRKLTEETGGSSAKIAELFNEIRGEQGFTQLSLRLGVFEDALKKLQESDTLKGANKIFEDLPGQKFFQEMEKLNNVFIEFKEIALKVLIEVTEKFGGLSKVIEGSIYLTGALGGAIGLIYVASYWTAFTGAVRTTAGAFRLLSLSIASVPLALAALPAAAIAATAGLIAGAIAGIGGSILASEEDRKNLGIFNQADAEERAKAQTEVIVKENEDRLEEDRKTLKRLESQALGYVAVVKAALTTIAKEEKTAFLAVNKELENSFQLVSKYFKKTIGDMEAREKAAIDNVEKTKERRISARQKSDESLFNRRLKVNELNKQYGFPDLEGVIRGRRIGELQAQARALAKSRDPKQADAAIAAIEKARALADEAALETITVPTAWGGTEEILKYSNAWQKSNELGTEHQRIINQIRATNAEIAREENQKIIAAEKKLKTIQDAADALTKFKVFDEAGKPIYDTPEEAQKELNKRTKDYQGAIKGQLPADTILEHGISFQNFLDKATAQIHQLHKTIADQLKTQVEDERAKSLAEGIAAQTTTNEAELVRLTKEQNDLAAKLSVASKTAGASIETLLGNIEKTLFEKIKSRLAPNSYNEYTPKRVPEEVETEIGGIKKLYKAGDYESAARSIGHLLETIKKYGLLELPVAGKYAGKTLPEGALSNNPGVKRVSPDTLGGEVESTRVALQIAAGLNQELEESNYRQRLIKSESEKMTETTRKYASNYVTLTDSVKDFVTNTGGAFDTLNADCSTLLGSMEELVKKMKTLGSTAAGIRALQSPISAFPGTKTDELRGIFPPGDFLGGAINYRSDGGSMYDFLSGRLGRGSDQIPVMAADGERMMNRAANDRWAPQLIAMNAGFEPSLGRGEQGGNTYNIGDINVHMRGGDSPNQTARGMAAELKRQIRRGTITL